MSKESKDIMSEPDKSIINKQPKYEYNTTGRVNNISQEFGLMITLQENLNLRIGTERWGKYISSIFWYYVSTPINFTITLFTALSSGQVGTGTNFLSNESLFAILFTTFLLSTINTFFRLKESTESNYKISQQFDEFVIKFEDIYFQPIKSDEDVYIRYTNYKILQNEINTYCKNTGIENANYLTGMIFSCCKLICLKGKTKAIPSSERFWILDGKKKCEIYNKKFLTVDMSNFEFDIERVDEHNLHDLHITPTEKKNETKNIITIYIFYNYVLDNLLNVLLLFYLLIYLL